MNDSSQQTNGVAAQQLRCDARTIVVVGASLGGLRVLEELRRLGWHENVVVIGDEPHMPYTRPPLSKKLLATGGSVDDVLLRRRPSDHPTQWKLGTEVVAADLTARTVELADSTSIAYDGLVAATGVRARRIPGDDAVSRRRVLRTVDDSIAVSAALTPGARIVIIGAGFIGCEVASVARQRGCEVAVVALDQEPMQIPLGTMVGAELRRRHEESGIDFNLGRSVERFQDGPDHTTVVLDNGAQLDADLILEAIGSVPSTSWLDGNGLDLTNGVLCDSRMRVVGADSVVAVGDVARFPHPLFGESARRIEHWHVPGDSATIAAASLLVSLGATREDVAEPAPFDVVPSFASHQVVASIRSFGSPGLADAVSVLEGDLDGDVAIGYHRNGEMVAVVLVGMAAQAGRFLTELDDALRAPVSGAL